MYNFWTRRAPKFTEEDGYYFIKNLLREYGGEEDFYARNGNNSSSNQRYNRGGNSYHEQKEEKLKELAEVYTTLCDFFEEIGIKPESLVEQGQYRR